MVEAALHQDETIMIEDPELLESNGRLPISGIDQENMYMTERAYVRSGSNKFKAGGRKSLGSPTLAAGSDPQIMTLLKQMM